MTNNKSAHWAYIAKLMESSACGTLLIYAEMKLIASQYHFGTQHAFKLYCAADLALYFFEFAFYNVIIGGGAWA